MDKQSEQVDRYKPSICVEGNVSRAGMIQSEDGNFVHIMSYQRQERRADEAEARAERAEKDRIQAVTTAAEEARKRRSVEFERDRYRSLTDPHGKVVMPLQSDVDRAKELEAENQRLREERDRLSLRCHESNARDFAEGVWLMKGGGMTWLRSCEDDDKRDAMKPVVEAAWSMNRENWDALGDLHYFPDAALHLDEALKQYNERPSPPDEPGDQPEQSGELPSQADSSVTGEPQNRDMPIIERASFVDPDQIKREAKREVLESLLHAFKAKRCVLDDLADLHAKDGLYHDAAAALTEAEAWIDPLNIVKEELDNCQQEGGE